jgi:hypothetical protein
MHRVCWTCATKSRSEASSWEADLGVTSEVGCADGLERRQIKAVGEVEGCGGGAAKGSWRNAGRSRKWGRDGKATDVEHARRGPRSRRPGCQCLAGWCELERRLHGGLAAGCTARQTALQNQHTSSRYVHAEQTGLTQALVHSQKWLYAGVQVGAPNHHREEWDPDAPLPRAPVVGLAVWVGGWLGPVVGTGERSCRVQRPPNLLAGLPGGGRLH